MQEKEKKCGPLIDEVWQVSLSGLVFFALLLVFIGAAIEVRNDPEINLDLKVFGVGGGLLLFTGLMFFSAIGVLLKLEWAQRLNELLAVVGFAFIMVFLMILAFRSVFFPDSGFAIEKWQGLFFITILLWICIGLGLFISAQRSQKKDNIFRSPLVIPFWPAIFFFKSMALFSVLFLIYMIFVGGGEWIGSFVNHSFIGAWAGFGLLVLIICLIRRTYRKDTGG